MKLLTAFLALVLLTIGCSGNWQKGFRSSGESRQKRAETIDNELVVSGSLAVIEEFLSSKGVQAQIAPVAPTAQNLYHVRLEGKVDLDSLIADLEGKVDFVEPNYRVRAESMVDKYSWPNDRLFFKQWAMNNIGQNPPFGLPGSEGADIDIINAWNISKGSKEVVVAIIDTGVDYTHPDLKENIWVNEKESEQNGGVPGKDDDGNGYIDDIYGFDFTSAGRTDLKWGVPGDPDPMDEDGHGTHCAGTIGAAASNAQGVAGVNWNVRIMPLRFIGGGGGSTVDAVRAIYYAVDKKVNVMSNSWGGGGDSKALRNAIAAAQKAGILFVVAAGNDGKNIDVEATYPASIDKDTKGLPITNVVSVGASDNQDNPADFSNYGHKLVHLFAPGVQIVSTFPVKLAENNKPYAIMSGTSMAAPFVAGVAALMMANNPSLRGQPELVKQLLMQTGDQRESLLGKSISSARLNAYRAVTAKATSTSPENWVSKGQNISERGYHRELVDIRHEIKVPNAKAIRVHFDFLQIEAPYDTIYLYDKNYRLVSTVEEMEGTDYWSAVVPGDTVYVRYTNSLVKQVSMSMSPPVESESSCASMGAEEILQTASGQFQCLADNEDSGGDGSRTYSTFNSEGYSVDRIEYLSEQGAQP